MTCPGMAGVAASSAGVGSYRCPWQTIVPVRRRRTDEIGDAIVHVAMSHATGWAAGRRLLFYLCYSL